MTRGVEERIATGLKPLAMTSVWRNGLPRGLLTLAVPKSCFRLEREQLLTAAPAVARNDKGSESREVNCNDVQTKV